MRVGIRKLVLQVVAEPLVQTDMHGIVKGIGIVLDVQQQEEIGILASGDEKRKRPEAAAVGLKDKVGRIPIVGLR